MEFSRTGPATTISNDRRKHPSCPFDMSLNSSTLMIAQPTGSQVRDSPRQPSYSYVLAYLVGSASPTSSSSTILALFWVGGIPTAKYEFYKKNFKKNWEHLQDSSSLFRTTPTNLLASWGEDGGIALVSRATSSFPVVWGRTQLPRRIVKMKV